MPSDQAPCLVVPVMLVDQLGRAGLFDGQPAKPTNHLSKICHKLINQLLMVKLFFSAGSWQRDAFISGSHLCFCHLCANHSSFPVLMLLNSNRLPFTSHHLQCTSYFSLAPSLVPPRCSSNAASICLLWARLKWFFQSPTSPFLKMTLPIWPWESLELSFMAPKVLCSAILWVCASVRLKPKNSEICRTPSLRSSLSSSNVTIITLGSSTRFSQART